jgi:hypothetical protein
VVFALPPAKPLRRIATLFVAGARPFLEGGHLFVVSLSNGAVYEIFRRR